MPYSTGKQAPNAFNKCLDLSGLSIKKALDNIYSMNKIAFHLFSLLGERLSIKCYNV